MNRPVVAAFVGVMDEVELIDRQLSHLRQIGIDHVVVVDAGSTDGTQDILADHAASGRITLIRAQYLEPAGHQTIWAGLRRFISELSPDWILINDADDFCVPATGDLPTALQGATADVVRLPRFNVPVMADGPLWPERIDPGTLDALLLVTRPRADLSTHLEPHPESPWILGRIANKIVTRPHGVADVGLGAHEIVPVPGYTPTCETARDVLVAHVPFSGYERFSRKVRNIQQLFSYHADRFSPQQARHWRRWVALLGQDMLPAEYARQCLSSGQFGELMQDGRIESAADWFRAGHLPG